MFFRHLFNDIIYTNKVWGGYICLIIFNKKNLLHNFQKNLLVN